MRITQSLEASSTTSTMNEEDAGSASSFDQMKLCFMIGVLAIALPIVLAIYGVATSQFHQTISHFYYTDRFAEELFVGTLVGLGLIMLAYEGFSNNPTERRSEAKLASLGGLFAMGVAFFPTDGWLVSRINFQKDRGFDYYNRAPEQPLDAIIGCAHVVCAGLLFCLLAYFCLKIFTREHYKKQAEQETKKRRNFRYRISGYIIIGCIAAIGVAKVTKIDQGDLWNWARGTFLLESIMLIAFGYSWLVKSRFYGTDLLDPVQIRSKSAS